MIPELYGVDMVGEFNPISWSDQQIEDDTERCRTYTRSLDDRSVES